MINKDGLIYRNLQEQVAKNKDDIQAILDANNLGIRVIGNVATASDLPSAETFEGNYGDAYAVGTEGNYEIYVWTRPDSTHSSAFWFNLGHIGMEGPKGDKGDKGDVGQTGASTQWFSYSTNPTIITGYKNGDLWLNTTSGDVYKLKTGSPNYWSKVANIKGDKGDTGAQGIQGIQGPQGETGPQGPTGDPGGFIHIVGTLASEDDLPTPTALGDLTAAFLVGASEHLYIQIGTSLATATWKDIGVLNLGTYVTSGGQYQGTWDADTKLDKRTTTSQYQRAYIVNTDGSQGFKVINEDSITNSLVVRDGNGRIRALNPSGSDNYEVVTVGYLNNALGDIESLLEAI